MANISEYDIKRSVEVYLDSNLSYTIAYDGVQNSIVDTLDSYVEHIFLALDRPARRTNGGIARCAFLVNFRFKNRGTSGVKDFFLGQEILANILDNGVINVSDGTSNLGTLRIVDVSVNRYTEGGYDIFSNSCTGEIILTG